MANVLSMDQALVEKLNKILENNLEKERFGVKELAKEAGLSRSQLHRKLKYLTKKSPSRYIREFRLEKAMEMLQNYSATASEIAYRVGFSSPTYFNTCFHDYYGYPPGEVKFRNFKVTDIEKESEKLELVDELQVKQEDPTFNNSLLRKRMVWVNTFFIVLLSAISYSLYQNYKNTPAEGLTFTGEQDKSIAVLPFKNLSNDTDNQYFADGVSASILNNLNKISDLKVIPSSSMEKYRKTNLSATEIAKEVNAMYLLEGSVQKYGDSIRIISSLINGRENKQIRSFVFDWEYNHIFDIQTKIALDIAKQLDLSIAPENLEAIQKHPTENIEAYNLWLLANFQLSKGSKNSFENAVSLYQDAIALDSSFVDAYVNQAGLWLFGGAIWGSYNEQEAWSNAKFLLQMAQEMDSNNFQVKKWLHIGYFYYDWNFNAYEKIYKENINLGIEYNDFLSDYAVKTGRFEDALSITNQLIQAYPTIGFHYALKAQALFYLNRKVEALNVLNLNDGLFRDNMDYLREASKYYFYLQKYERSKQLLGKIDNNFADNTPILIWLNAVIEEKNSKVEKANKFIIELEEKYKNNTSGSPAWFIALYYCEIKDFDNAFLWLQKSYERHEVEMLWLREEPVLIPLRNDPRYIDLYKKVGFPMKPHTL